MASRKILQLIICLSVIACDAKYSIVNHTIVLKECDINEVIFIRDVFPAPKEIIINHCKVQELPNAVFIRFTMLKILEISECNLNYIEDFAFNGLKNLETLIIK